MIRIVTDTTSSLTREEYQKYQIIPIPLYIIESHKIKKDLFQISTEEFYTRQRKGARFTTGPVSTEDFLETFRPIINAGDEIICLLLSSKISASYKEALAAKKILQTDRISIVDSKQSGFGLAYMAIKARELAEQGYTREEIVRKIQDLPGRSTIFFVVGSLNHLKAGGRLTGVKILAIISSLFNIKPVLWFNKSGKLKAYKKMGSVETVKAQTLELVRNKAKRGFEKIILHYADNYDEAVKYAKELEVIAGLPVELIRLSPAVGAHTGPDLLGPYFISKY